MQACRGALLKKTKGSRRMCVCVCVCVRVCVCVCVTHMPPAAIFSRENIAM